MAHRHTGKESQENLVQHPLTPWQPSTSDDAVKAGFGENFELFPKETYLQSNTPVCKKHYGVSSLDFFRIPGQSWAHLFNVDPSTSAIEPPLFDDEPYHDC